MENSLTDRDRAIRRVLWIVFYMNVAILAVKIFVWMFSHALSVAAEATHSSLDAVNNIFALTVARMAAEGPDADHPYGHHKFETLGALALAGILSVTVYELARSAVLRLVSGPTGALNASPAMVALLAFSAVAGTAVSQWEAREAHRYRADLLFADAAHTRSDVYATLAVLAGLIAVGAGYPIVDPLVTLVVAVIIARTGWHIIRGTIPVLVDERAVHPATIQAATREVDGVEACYHIRSRGRPGEIFAEITIAVDPSLDVIASHAIADEVEARVGAAIEAREVVVHVEPSGPVDGTGDPSHRDETKEAGA
ncbi:MAG: cation diffusion facilitator family transporter [Gemmatimonadota bacterium]|nr:cation diffusion facilitator family transporter [Gemmatimonadota bacterium]MDH5757984.1 cation diffusion facilitator family transporter [Gemmatimonadota bacterium]